MPTFFDWNTVPVLRRDRIADAENYAKQLNHGLSFHAWLHVGNGLIEWRAAALELAGGSQDMDTPAYRRAWAAAKPSYPNLTSIAEDKAVRSYAIWMTENRDVLENWYAGLSNKERRNWNHPRTIWNHSPLGRATKEAQRAAPKERKTAARDLHEAVDRIAGVADQIERTTGGASSLIFDMAPELIAESARNFVDIYGPEDTARFAKALLAIVAPAPAPEGPVLDPAFTGSLSAPKKRVRKPAATKVRRGALK